MSFWNNIKLRCAQAFPSCREAAHAQSDALEHPLPARRRFGLFLHLLICKWCRRYGEQIHFLHEAAQKRPDELCAPAKLSEEARERIKRELKGK